MAEQARDKVRYLARLLALGYITLASWEAAMRSEIEAEYIRQWVKGRGGIEQMTAADWADIQTVLNTQYGYLSEFRADIGVSQMIGKPMSEDQIGARSELYIASATQAFERGKAAKAALVLPAYPGDGSTPCLTNCQCEWRIEDDRAYWELGRAEHCDVCVERNKTWYPYVAGT